MPRAVRLGLVAVLALAAALLIPRLSAPVAAQSPYPTTPSAQAVISGCPGPLVTPIDVCINRGDGAIYYEGESISICVVVNFQALIQTRTRVTNFVDGAFKRVLLDEPAQNGPRCFSGVIGRPLGQERIVAELIGANGVTFGTSSATFQSVPRPAPTPPPFPPFPPFPPTPIPPHYPLCPSYFPHCPASITINRGYGSHYFLNERIIVCITVFVDHPLHIRGIYHAGGTPYYTRHFGDFRGQRCFVTTVRRPRGHQFLRLEACDPRTGAVLYTQDVEYYTWR